MCPLIDLVNHAQEQSTVRFFVTPASLHVQMLDIEIDRQTVEELEAEAYDQARGLKQEIEDGTLC